jgi:polynucleotide 5'-kinase involved in rRNA processing
MAAPGDASVSLLPVSARTAGKTTEERRTYREARFRAYFAQAQRLSLFLSEVGWRGLPLSQGRVLTMEECQRYADLLGTPVLRGETDTRRTVLLVEEMSTACQGAIAAEKLVFLTWPSLAYRLTGLLDGRHRTLALGLILPQAWDGRTISLLTPLPSSRATAVRYLHVGQRRVHPLGQELG